MMMMMMIFIYIVIHRQTVSFYYNSLVWRDKWDASSWDWNPSVEYLTPEPSSFSALVKEFFTYIFYVYVIGYVYDIGYIFFTYTLSATVSANVVTGKFPARVINSREGGWICVDVQQYIYIYIYIVIHRQTVSLYHNSSEWLDT